MLVVLLTFVAGCGCDWLCKCRCDWLCRSGVAVLPPLMPPAVLPAPLVFIGLGLLVVVVTLVVLPWLVWCYVCCFVCAVMCPRWRRCCCVAREVVLCVEATRAG